MLLLIALLVPGAGASDATLAQASEPASVSVPADGLAPLPAAPPDRWRLTVEGGALWTSRNDVRIPGDTGTRFSLLDLTGRGAWPVGRVTIEHDLSDRHGLRFLYAPVRTDGTGNLSATTVFDDAVFSPGPARARYRFDTYRLAYRYRFWKSEDWEWKGGLSALIRDASIEVESGTTSARNTDLGVVPLLNLTGEWRFADRWSATLDFEGAAAPMGRAVDLALLLGHDVGERTRLSLGYRTIEGGADNDSVFTFTWIHAVVASVRWSW